MKLTDRDKHLCAVLAHGRWLTAEQVTGLAFPERNGRDVRRRLHQLSGGEGAPALLARHRWATLDGVRHVWRLTDAGYREAEQLLDEELWVPPAGFEHQTMAHHVAMTELYVGLLAAPLDAAMKRIPPGLKPGQRKKALAGLYARALHRGWRWTVVGDGVHLPWKGHEGGRTRDRVMRPDAVLELHEPRRRVFVECETGTNTIVPRHADNKPNSTLSKLERWNSYVTVGDGQRTWYELTHSDGYAPEVLFLVPTDRRARSVTAAVHQWYEKQHNARLTVRVWTLEQALGELLPASGALRAEPPPRVPGGPAPHVLTDVEAAALVRFVNGASAQLEEQLRHAAIQRTAGPPVPEGWEMAKLLARRLRHARAGGGQAASGKSPHTSGEFRLLRDYSVAAFAAMRQVRADARKQQAAVPAYPERHEEVRALLRQLFPAK